MQNTIHRFHLWQYSLLGFVILLIAVVWGLDRGFDMTDEAFYVMSYLYPQITLRGNSFYQTVMPKLVGAEATVVELRLAKLIINLGLSALLAFSMQHFANQRQLKSFITFFSFAFIGLYFGSTWLPQTPSYNDFSNWGLALCVFGLLLSAANNATKAFQIMGGFFIGVGSFVSAIAKVPAFGAILGFLVLLLGLALFLKAEKTKLLKIFFGYFIGLAFGLFIFHLLVLPLNEAFEIFKSAFQATTSREIYRPSSLITEYIVQVTKHFYKMGLFILPFVVWFSPNLRQFISNKIGEKKFRLILYIYFLVVAVTLYKSNIHLPRGGTKIPTMFYNLILLATILVLPNLLNLKNNKLYLMTGITLLLPILGAFGTGNGIVAQSTVHIFPIFLLFSMYLNQQGELNNKKIIALLSIFYLFLGSHFFHGYLRKPYRLAAPLWQQNTKSDSLQLRVDANTANFYIQLNQLKSEHFSQNSEGLFFSGGAGVIYALHLKSRGEPWYFHREPEKTCRALERGTRSNAPKDPHPVVFVDEELNPIVEDCLKSILNIKLNENYVKVATLESPYPDRVPIQIYKKKN